VDFDEILSGVALRGKPDKKAGRDGRKVHKPKLAREAAAYESRRERVEHPRDDGKTCRPA
jgi:hypothetical protein